MKKDKGRKTDAAQREPAGKMGPKWIIFNKGEVYEFAECSRCHREQEPTILMGRTYPKQCAGCGAWMDGQVIAETIDGADGQVIAEEIDG